MYLMTKCKDDAQNLILDANDNDDDRDQKPMKQHNNSEHFVTFNKQDVNKFYTSFLLLAIDYSILMAIKQKRN